MNTVFPPPFAKAMRTQLGNAEWEALEAALQTAPPVSIRLNPNKVPNDLSLLPATDGAVPWCPQGRYLPDRPVFTLDPLFHAGAYYVQEAASMFLHEVLRQSGRLGQPLRVLDLCAAPGGKTTLVYDAVQAQLTANEIVPNRAAVLRENLEKWGIPDAAVTCADPAAFEGIQEWFDLVVVDAPCSGEGMFRKDPNAIQEWSPDNVTVCVGRQSRILEVAKQVLAPGGLLLYSTCTFNRAENETQMAAHFAQGPYTAVTVDTQHLPGIEVAEIGFRFMPHRTRGEGFYLAAWEKKESENRVKPPVSAPFKQLTPLPKKILPTVTPWLHTPEAYAFWQTASGDILALPTESAVQMSLLDRHIKGKWFGCHLGTLKGNDLIPGQALAQSTAIRHDMPAVELTRTQALAFLKKETFDLPPDAPKGWALAKYSGLALGWMKVLPNRMNNYLPQERRIRMEVR